jgi:hypothetical protein
MGMGYLRSFCWVGLLATVGMATASAAGISGDLNLKSTNGKDQFRGKITGAAAESLFALLKYKTTAFVGNMPKTDEPVIVGGMACYQEHGPGWRYKYHCTFTIDATGKVDPVDERQP